MSKSCDWSEDKRSALTLLWAQADKSALAIANELNAKFGLMLTRHSVIGKADRMQLGPKVAKPGGVPHNCFRSMSAAPTLKDRRVGGFIEKQRIDRMALVPKALPRQSLTPTIYDIANAIALINRKPRQCAFILGPSYGPTTLMCGKAVHRKSLCAKHYAACWTTRAPRTRPDKIKKRVSLLLEWGVGA